MNKTLTSLLGFWDWEFDNKQSIYLFSWSCDDIFCHIHCNCKTPEVVDANTVPIDRILSVKNARVCVSMDIK